jgi:hypothetical protein
MRSAPTSQLRRACLRALPEKGQACYDSDLTDIIGGRFDAGMRWGASLIVFDAAWVGINEHRRLVGALESKLQVRQRSPQFSMFFSWTGTYFCLSA